MKYSNVLFRSYLSWGHVSLRTVFQALSSRQEELRGVKKLGRDTGRWLRSMSAFGSRLRWRSHFAQKLSDEPSIEHENMCRAYDGLRAQLDHAKLDAWSNGRTGFPMVDACMRALEHSGWINFRMRAMLVSFACYDLWLDWRPLAPILARRFLDYEPGIHYPQLQMQAGTTGMNANRIYSATKQVHPRDLTSHIQPVTRCNATGSRSRGAGLRVHQALGARALPRSRALHA
jgi:deoxyribodipyrimidine photo-lyase